jgi:hypothetical protein
MKWLKLFEGFETDDYYVKIEDTSVVDDYKFFDQMIDFSDILKVKPMVNMDVDSKICNINPPGGTLIRYLYLEERGDGIESYSIYKLDDDWYYVQVEKYYPDIDSGEMEFESMEWYKCDQLEGLIKFLKDKNIIK